MTTSFRSTFPFVLAAGFAALALSGCAPYVRSQFAHPGFSVADVGKSGAAVIVTTSPLVLEFQQSYESAYGTGDSLARAVSVLISGQLGAGSRAFAMDERTATRLASLKDPAQAERNTAFLKSLGNRYLLHVHGIVIRQVNTAVYNGGNAVQCVTLFKADIWDAESGQKLASFEVDGSASVFLFAYQAALYSSIYNVSTRTVAYLKTGYVGP